MNQSQLKRMPAEWEKHQGILLSFPHNGADWPGKYAAIQWAFIEFISKISTSETVFLIVKAENQKKHVVEMCKRAHIDLEKIKFIIQDTNRSWMRDSGPIVVVDNSGKREALQFKFNAWAKYKNYRKDKLIPKAVASSLNIPLKQVTYKSKPVALEGGAIDVNGKGTLITTEECLLDEKIQVRNFGFTKLDYESVFSEFLGVTNVIWLGKGIEGDDTHGHVDDICRFVNENTVVVCEETDKSDINHKRMKDNIKRLETARLENGKSINIVTVPLPKRIDFENMRLPASYVNFLITNKSVLVPTFNDKNDYIALTTFNKLFPDREIIGINCTDLVWGLGTLHCLSHEIPA